MVQGIDTRVLCAIYFRIYDAVNRFDRASREIYNPSMSKNISFSENIYKIVERIPPGFVMTYGQIALLIGHPRASRQVGGAMRGVPDGRNLPCHRVVNRFGEMAPEHVFGSRDYQRAMLESEGVTFLSDGKINLARYIWSPPDENSRA